MPPPTYIYNRDEISIPSTYGRQNTSPAPGVVAGIVLGSVAGFLFLLYLLYLALSSGRRFGSETTPSEIVDVGIGSRLAASSAARRAGSSRRQRNQIIVEESMTSASAFQSEVDEVIVEEELSTVDGRSSPRVRRVDPGAYGGGSSLTSGH